MNHVKSASLSDVKIQARQNGNYIIGSAYEPADFDNGTISIQILKDMNILQISYFTNSSLDNAINNDLVGIQFYNGIIKFS